LEARTALLPPEVAAVEPDAPREAAAEVAAVAAPVAQQEAAAVAVAVPVAQQAAAAVAVAVPVAQREAVAVAAAVAQQEAVAAAAAVPVAQQEAAAVAAAVPVAQQEAVAVAAEVPVAQQQAAVVAAAAMKLMVRPLVPWVETAEMAVVRLWIRAAAFSAPALEPQVVPAAKELAAADQRPAACHSRTAAVGRLILAAVAGLWFQGPPSALGREEPAKEKVAVGRLNPATAVRLWFRGPSSALGQQVAAKEKAAAVGLWSREVSFLLPIPE
jgi:hypothetical protein